MIRFIACLSVLIFFTGCADKAPVPETKVCSHTKYAIDLKPLNLQGDNLTYTQEEVQLHLKNALLKTGCFSFDTTPLTPSRHAIFGGLNSNYVSEVKRTFLSKRRIETLRVNITLQTKDPGDPNRTLRYHANSIVEYESKTVMGIGRSGAEYEAAKRKALILATEEMAQKISANL